MNAKLQLLLIIFNFLLVFTSISQQKENNNKTYQIKKGDFNGIGKWYLGREIAHVMGFQGINWLERATREKEENTSTLIKNMQIKSTDYIADIGAGSGYHVFKMVSLAKKGKVFAFDIQLEMLAAILENKKIEQNKNIHVVAGSEKTVNLKENSIDKVLLVDVYHEFSFPEEILASIYKSLKKDGKIYLIEYRLEDNNVPIKRIHKMSEKQTIKEFKANGFTLEKNPQNLPWQHCMIFTKA